MIGGNMILFYYTIQSSAARSTMTKATIIILLLIKQRHSELSTFTNGHQSVIWQRITYHGKILNALCTSLLGCFGIVGLHSQVNAIHENHIIIISRRLL